MPPTAPRCPCSLLFPGKISSRCQFQQRLGRRVPETSQGSRLLVSVLFSLKKELTPITAALKKELTSRQEARESRIDGSLKPFRWNPAGNQSRPVEPDQQPEASLAWWVGDHPCEA